jgi:hypothetical protein
MVRLAFSHPWTTAHQPEKANRFYFAIAQSMKSFAGNTALRACKKSNLSLSILNNLCRAGDIN